jgi:hypothetical protein
MPSSITAVAPDAAAARPIIYLGMDVHTDSITIEGPAAAAKTPSRLDRLPNDLPKLKRWLERVARYAVSPRGYPATLPALEYPGHFLVKRVTHVGAIRFKHRLLFLANALKEHHGGLEESDDGIWSLYLGSVLLGKIDEATMKVYG